MATYYIDTSALVSALLREPVLSGRVRAWLRAHEEEALAVSWWVGTEVASALSTKIRTGELSPEQRADAWSEWSRFRDDSLMVLPVEADAFETAALFAGRHDLALRASDALHLAIAAAHGCALVTLDNRLAKAAPELGVPVAEV